MTDSSGGEHPSALWTQKALDSLAQVPSEHVWLGLIALAVIAVGWALRHSLLRRLRTAAVKARASAGEARWSLSGPERVDLAYMSDTEASLRDAPARTSTVFLFSCAGLLVAFVGWAYFATLEEVTRGDGSVIPSTKTQIVQSLEGGIVKSLETREGDLVRQGQVLLRIDDTGFASDLGSLRAQERALRAQTERLRVEASGVPVEDIGFSQDLVQQASDVVENETVLYEIRRSNHDNQVDMLNERLSQRKQELAELHENRKRLQEGLDIANRERAIKEPLAQRGIVPMPELLRLEREISDLRGQLATTEQSLPRVESSIREAERQLDEQRFTFRQVAQGELNTKLSELAQVRETLRSAQDKVSRTDIASPVDGIVNKLHINTVGGVIGAGEPMVEITPIEDTLLVEARVSASDIAFIRPGQQALVKITAYDFTVFGGIDGKVELISSDSVRDEESNERFYSVIIRTDMAELQSGNEVLPIIPGMVASIDIITGEKSVLDYILNPIVRARHEALRER